MKLNPEQQVAANAIDGVYVTIAGPGSGKTTTMIQRYKNMIASGIPTYDILNLTFTHSAAAEMVERVGTDDGVFKTFHSFAIDLLKKEKYHLPFSLCDTIIPASMEEYAMLFDLAKTYPVKSWRVLQEKIAGFKKKNVSPEKAIEEAVQADYGYVMAYQDYEKKCRQQGWLDFDSVMQETVQLLENNEEVRNRHKRKYISVDECQDTDVVQFKLLQLIFGGNIFAVGDENQLIYEWRSAQSGNLTNFAKMFPGAKTLFLGQNYRSTVKLVDFYKDILPVDNGIASHMITENEEGVEPVFQEYPDPDVEAETILNQITDPEHTAIIARTNRQLFLYQKLCTIRQIKYKFLGKKDIWEQNEVKKLLGLAKPIRDGRPANEVLDGLITEHNLMEIYRDSGRPLESSPGENLQDIVKMAAGKGSVQEFLAYLRKRTRGRKSAKGLVLSTVHQAKGKEWENVYVVGASQGKMPHSDGEIAEEKRIFFVACTRAGKALHISWSGNHSEFINEYVGG